MSFQFLEWMAVGLYWVQSHTVLSPCYSVSLADFHVMPGAMDCILGGPSVRTTSGPPTLSKNFCRFHNCLLQIK